MSLPVTFSHLYKIPFLHLPEAPPSPCLTSNKCQTNPQPLHTGTGECHNCAAPCCRTGFLPLPVQKQPSPSSLQCYPLELTIYSQFYNPLDQRSSTKTDFSTIIWFPQTHPLKGVQFSCHGSHTKSPGKHKVQK